MARWEITITDPLAELPSVVLPAIKGGGGSYARSQLQQISLGEYTQAGNTILQGRTIQKRFTWEITTRMLEDDMLLLLALIELQQERYAVSADGKLTLTDEVEYLPPVEAIDQKPLLSGSSKTISGKTTGFFQGPVFVAIEESPVQVGVDRGVSAAGASLNYKTVIITATEITGV